MPRKRTSVIDPIEEPQIKVLTSQDIVNTFSIADFTRIVKKCNVESDIVHKQHKSMWLRDESGDLHCIISDLAYKKCTYLGSYEGAKFEVVLEKSFYDTIKTYFREQR